MLDYISCVTYRSVLTVIFNDEQGGGREFFSTSRRAVGENKNDGIDHLQVVKF